MLDPRLRLILITDGVGDVARMVEVVDAAIAGGLRCVQVREPGWTARQTAKACEALRPRLDAADALLLVNDRVELAACGLAHGAQVGHRSLPPDLARRAVGEGALLGYSAHDRAQLDEASDAGCTFALLAPVWETASKPDAAPLGVARAATLTRDARLPVLWLGGVDEARLRTLGEAPLQTRPNGFAAMGAIMRAADPAAATRRLLAAQAG
jgi:thiamine-phosphate pyrophosphorylase